MIEYLKADQIQDLKDLREDQQKLEQFLMANRDLKEPKETLVHVKHSKDTKDLKEDQMLIDHKQDSRKVQLIRREEKQK